MILHSIEGNVQQLDGGAMFGNSPREVWQKWAKPDDRNRIRLACRGLLMVDDDGRKILFEAGIGNFFEEKLRERYGVLEAENVLVQNLEKQGFPHDEIDFVVLSHLHFDHAGGLLERLSDGSFKLLFPKAKFVVSDVQFKRALSPHLRDRASYIPELNQMLKDSGRLTVVSTESSESPISGVRFSISNGHTPGLLISIISPDNSPTVFISDLIPASPWVHCPITMGYDRYPELLIDEKKKILDFILNKNGKIFFTHDCDMPFGKLQIDNKGKYSVKTCAE
ncbi:MAG: MBL fold metallo-hydrolase [Candidatus Riflebacteria bacterium]|nr:MBL fold metallo-hydrolase [Candidatus Riflebacteria bacterium]